MLGCLLNMLLAFCILQYILLSYLKSTHTPEMARCESRKPKSSTLTIIVRGLDGWILREARRGT